MYMGLHVRRRLLLPDYSEIWIPSTEFRKILKYQFSLKKIRRVGAELFYADGQTDKHGEAHGRGRT